MHPQKSRFVAGTQQALVLGAVFAALVPAANVVSLDVVRDHPSDSADAGTTSVATALAAYEAAANRPTQVPTSVVEPHVTQIALTAPAPGTAPARATGTGTVRPALYAATPTGGATTVADDATGTTTILSEPADVTGFGTVGVTWGSGQKVEEGDISIELRTRTDGTWGEWTELGYHDDHGPDAGSAEARGARPGTDEALVGHVDQVQVKAEVATHAVPTDMTLAVIDPGKATSTKAETPEIDTNELATIPDAVPDSSGDLVDTAPTAEAPADGATEAPGADTTADTTADITGTAPTSSSRSTAPGALTLAAAPADLSATPSPGAQDVASGLEEATTEDALTLAASSVARPAIYSRAQWGANEKIREQTAPSYGTIHGAFVHHTVNANDYTAAEVPGIIRSIYSYHVKSKGWRDLGYNFLVDRFGRIWEGRYGGVDRPVVGAHTENYNGDSFAMSAIGNYDIAQPSQEFIGAYAALFAWKLSLHGVSASATNVKIGKKVFPSSIMGHRDTKSTACPGKYLYARIPDIRRATAALQKGWTFTARNANLAGTAHPDLIVRRVSDKRGVIIPTTGRSGFGASVKSSGSASSTFALSPDLTGDGRADLISYTAKGVLAIRAGNGKGGFGGASHKSTKAKGRNLVVPVGDINGDGKNDLITRKAKGGKLALLAGTGRGTFVKRKIVAKSFKSFNWIGAGDVNGDGRVDLLARTSAGQMYWFPGNGRGALSTRRSLGAGFTNATSLAVADFNLDGRADLIYRNRTNGKGYVRLGNGGSGFSGNLGPYPGFKTITSIAGATQVTGGASPEVLTVTGGTLRLKKKKDTTDLGAPILTNLNLAGANLVLNAGDWNGDGKGDVIYRRTDGVLVLTLGNGAGTFSGAYSLGNFGSYTLIAATGDMTGDGRPDLMAQNASGMKVFPGNGATGVGASYTVYGRVGGNDQVAGGAWDADKVPDVLVRNGDSLVLYRGNGPGGLSSPVTVATGMSAYTWVIGVGSLSGTGHSDLVARDRAGQLWALEGTGTGTLKTRRILGYGFGAYDLAG